MKQPRKRRQISPSRASVLPSAACVFPGPFLLRHPRLHSGGRRRHLGSSACFASLRRLVAFVAAGWLVSFTNPSQARWLCQVESDAHRRSVVALLLLIVTSVFGSYPRFITLTISGY
ncbi:hypothetical protein DAI22_07g189950 [Oryza sativa Japonica Group]|nr:hypothetical protein DAI22_07g189950 [Oryza sativa Japonica Group]